MWKWHTVTLHCIVTVSNNMFNHLDGVMWAFAQKITQWNEDFYFTVGYVQQKLSKCYSEATPTTSLLVISAYILDPFRKLQLCRNWNHGKIINPDDETLNTMQYQSALLKFLENQSCAKHWVLSVNKPERVTTKNPFSSTMASWSSQSFLNKYHLSGDDDEYLTSKNVVGVTLRRRNRKARWLAAPRLYLNSSPESPKYCGHVNPNHNDYHSNPIDIESTFWLPNITDWWQQHE